jgi:CRP-like cAMP-binding protein
MDDGSSREIMRLGVGDIFGELSLITGLPRTCSGFYFKMFLLLYNLLFLVIANEDSVVLELTKEKFDKLINQYQNLRQEIPYFILSKEN